MLALLFGIAQAGAASAAPDGSAAAAPSSCRAPGWEAFLVHGRVHACGNDLVDAAGHRVRLLSYEILNLYGGEGDVTPECGHWTPVPTGLGWKVPRWGMNSVQMLVSWSNLEPTRPTLWPGGAVHHHWNTEYLDALDDAIAMFRRHGIAVVLTMGQSKWSQAFRNIRRWDGTVYQCGLGMPEWLYPNGGSTWAMVQAERRFFHDPDGYQKKFRYVWRMLARRYRSNPTVVAAGMLFEAPDLISQPWLGRSTPPEALDLARFYELTGRAIHRVNPHLVVMYADWQSRGSVPYYAITRKPRLRNAAEAYEFYANSWDSDIRARFENYHDRAVQWNVPGYIDEFDAFEYGRRTDPELPGDPHWARDTVAMLQQATADRTGWSFNGLMDARIARVLRQGH